MSKTRPLDKVQARDRRNRLLDAAATGELSLTEAVREMRSVAGMTQDEFARHRGVSARVIKAIELGQGNPTVATLNRIGQFFGLEVAFVPVKRTPAVSAQSQPAAVPTELSAQLSRAAGTSDYLRTIEETRDSIRRQLREALGALDIVALDLSRLDPTQKSAPEDTGAANRPARKRKPRTS